MVQVQSSWFPLVDRNPQKFMRIPGAKETDFINSTIRIYHEPEGHKTQTRIEIIHFNLVNNEII